jgi:Zn-dependent protease with chaperone function
MQLSYWVRLLLLISFSAGLVQAVIALLMRLERPVFGRALARLSARWQERVCFTLPIVPHLAAALAACVIVPLYIYTETEPFNERVGVLCVAGALLVAARYAYALARALRLAWRARSAREPKIAASVAGVPVRLSTSEHAPLAVRGILWPEIIVSRSLLLPTALSPEALEIALAHEQAHIRQFDNFKLFVLSSLLLPGFPSAAQIRWRRAAEIAADNDAAAGSRTRAILLAETLLTIARSEQERALPALVLPLLAHEEELETRIHRLLGEETRSAACDGRFNQLGTILLFFATAGLLLAFAIVPFHRFAECVLHLG